MNVSFTLQAARINSGYTQKEVANKLKVNVNTIVSWEKDSSNLNFTRIQQLSTLYKVPMNMLFFGNKNEFIRKIRKNGFELLTS
ncbi:helix-turn-helix transcriptional regulator [Apilactobacillus xinyiensis]|uniref:helix-turn-helix transcriptional regulator n=1 Tax=Apilactobacillus xinyiensis TaxID=2841032 RepID=UPI003364BB60